MKTFTKSIKLMGSDFQLGVVSDDKISAREFLDLGVNEIKRIEHLLSEYLPDSQTTRINQKAFYSDIKIDDETFNLIDRSINISRLTKGCFDISVAPLKKMYNFKNQDFVFPSKEGVKETLKSVGYNKIQLNHKNRKIRLLDSQTRISFAAIGKGYASDMVKKLWLEKGVLSGFINASGDMNVFGNKADGSDWKIGIANPDMIAETLLFVPIRNASVATSGDYIQFFDYKGKRYSHNINPITGFPLVGIKSVTVFSPSAELSDALATAIYVKGVKEGIKFVNELPKTHVIIIDNKNKLFFSKNIEYEPVKV